MQWILCSEQPPPINKQVLAYGPCHGSLEGGERIDICVWDGYEWWDEGGTEIWGDTGWTHWMPLPETPTQIQQRIEKDSYIPILEGVQRMFIDKGFLNAAKFIGDEIQEMKILPEVPALECWKEDDRCNDCPFDFPNKSCTGFEWE
jgi:hypothetical protein